MNSIVVFSIGLALTMIVALLAIGYLRQPLKAILTDLCGTEERASFWAAFSNVTLFFTPVIFALHFRPQNGSATTLVYGLSDQLAAALLGFVAAIVMLGFVVGRFIARERMSRPAPQVAAKS